MRAPFSILTQTVTLLFTKPGTFVGLALLLLLTQAAFEYFRAVLATGGSVSTTVSIFVTVVYTVMTFMTLIAFILATHLQNLRMYGALLQSVRYLLRYILLILCITIAIVPGVLILSIGGVVASLIGGILIFVVALYASLAQFVLVLEEVGVFAAVRRTVRYVAKACLTVFIAFAGLFGVSLLYTWALSELLSMVNANLLQLGIVFIGSLVSMLIWMLYIYSLYQYLTSRATADTVTTQTVV